MDYKELRKIVEKDPELRQMKLNDYELHTAYRYLMMKESREKTDYIPTLVRTENSIEIVMVPTESFDEELKRRASLSNVGTLDTVNYILDAKLADFTLNTEERNDAYLKASRFIDLLKEGKTNKGLYLYGMYGTGKTYLLSAIVEEVSKYKKVLFIYFPDLVRNMKTSISTNELEDKVTALKTAELLVFDDVGSENMTGWFRDEILSPILQFRLASNLPILISSNFSQKQLIDFMATERHEIDRIKAARIVHRIRELTEEIPLSVPYKE